MSSQQKEGSGAQRLTRDGSSKLLEKCFKIWKQWQIKVFGVAFWLKAFSELQSCCWRLNTVTDENNLSLFPQRSFPNYSWKEEDLDSRTSDICWIPSVYRSTVLLPLWSCFPTEKKDKAFFFVASLILLFHETRPYDWKVQSPEKHCRPETLDLAEIHNWGQRQILVSRMSWCNVTARIIKGLEPP